MGHSSVPLHACHPVPIPTPCVRSPYRYAAMENASAMPQLTGFSRNQIAACIGSRPTTDTLLGNAKRLAERLTQLQSRDLNRYAQLASRAVGEAMGLPASKGGMGTALDAEKRAAFDLARLSGREASVTFDHLVSLLLSTRADEDLQLFNPFASQRQIASALELTSLALFTANRIGQAQRCLVEVNELAMSLQQLQPNARRSSMGVRPPPPLP